MGRKDQNKNSRGGGSKGGIRKNRNGIAVLEGHTNFYDLFSAEGSDEQRETLENKKHKTEQFDNANLKRHGEKYVKSINDDGQRDDLDCSGPDNRDDGEKSEWTRVAASCDKVISHKEIHFPPKRAGSQHPTHKNQAIEGMDGEADLEEKLRRQKKDKHGIPFLDGLGSLFRFFKDGKNTKQRKEHEEAEISDAPFPILLASSLKGKGETAMLREKSDKVLPTPIPLKKRLKRYPPPQQELDLHGLTAEKAKSRTESWVRRLWRNGFFTVRIIVGKGLHSEFGAVLPDVVEDLMVQLKQDGVVLWFEWERKQKSRSGALIVYLKRFD